MSGDDAPPSSPGDPPPPQAPDKRSRIARLVALAGALVVVLATRALVVPHVPEDHDIEVKLASPRDVIGLDVRWSAAETSEELATTSLHFSPGSAPASIRTTVHLPPGAYDVAIDVERVSGVDSTRRHITLTDSARVTIPLQ